MLRSLPCERIVVAISYGCIGRSVSATRTARASRFETARRPAMSFTHVHPVTYIRLRVYGCVYPSASKFSDSGVGAQNWGPGLEHRTAALGWSTELRPWAGAQNSGAGLEQRAPALDWSKGSRDPGLTARGGWGGDPVGPPLGGAHRTSQRRGRTGPPGGGGLDGRLRVPVRDGTGARPLLHVFHQRRAATGVPGGRARRPAGGLHPGAARHGAAGERARARRDGPGGRPRRAAPRGRLR